MIERIFSCIELLSAEMKALRKADQTKAAKVKAFLTRYGDAKGATPETLLCMDSLRGAGKATSSPVADSELKQCLQAVVTGIDCFHTSCEDIWDDTLSRVFSELDAMFMSLPSPPTQRWSPDNPCLPACLSLSSLDSLEEDRSSINKMARDKSKYGALVILSLRFLERMTNEFGHLMVVTRIKDLQIISIDHSIGLAYMSMRRMILPAIKMSPNCVKGLGERKKPGKLHKNHQKRKAQKLNDTMPKSHEMAPQEDNSKKRRKSNKTDLDKKEKQNGCKGQACQDGATTSKPPQSEKPEICAVPHMSVASDMHFPFLHADVSPAHVACSGIASSSTSSGFSPWPQPHPRDEAQHKHSTERVSIKPKANFPKLPAAAHRTSTKQSSERSLKPPSANIGSDPKFIQEKVLLCNELNEPVDCLGNTEHDKAMHRPIQYCRFLAVPTPPSTNLIAEERKAEADPDPVQLKMPRKPRFRLTSNDANEHSGKYSKDH
ncbi:hypothetical protein ElyMa_002009900 [Elysia marginata]|uniref:Uncharacterized protein n=1 Tax=Elysia marginata TaxID=1093978 RepID=A0AAV4F3Q5_9GAST|nr:hypothetical protein ElyMa_002009900 [Elysia marginata]